MNKMKQLTAIILANLFSLTTFGQTVNFKKGNLHFDFGLSGSKQFYVFTGPINVGSYHGNFITSDSSNSITQKRLGLQFQFALPHLFCMNQLSFFQRDLNYAAEMRHNFHDGMVSFTFMHQSTTKLAYESRKSGLNYSLGIGWMFFKNSSKFNVAPNINLDMSAILKTKILKNEYRYTNTIYSEAPDTVPYMSVTYYEGMATEYLEDKNQAQLNALFACAFYYSPFDRFKLYFNLGRSFQMTHFFRHDSIHEEVGPQFTFGFLFRFKAQS